MPSNIHVLHKQYKLFDCSKNSRIAKGLNSKGYKPNKFNMYILAKIKETTSIKWNAWVGLVGLWESSSS